MKDVMNTNNSVFKRFVRSIINFLINNTNLLMWLNGGSKKKKRPNQVFDTFCDSRGEVYDLITGYRDWIKPRWSMIYEPPVKIYSKEELKSAPERGKYCFNKFQNMVQASGVELKGNKLLEVGCFNGRESFTFAGYGNFEVIGIDLPEYYILESFNSTLTSNRIINESNHLTFLRDQVRKSFLTEEFSNSYLDRVKFLNEDIQKTSFKDQTFDIIISFEVLEHIRDPHIAFNEMYRILKPGGLIFHEYNPFFSINGGHSPCTLV